MKPSTPAVQNGYIATKTGILVPPGYNSRSNHAAGPNRLFQRHYSNFQHDGFAYGMRLERDPETLVIRWAAKGSGMDDLINKAIADGEIGNVGISPLIFPQINGLMKRRQNLAYSTSITVTGRDGPATRATNAIARFNDSPLGATESIRQIIYQLDTYNRGAPIATVPIIYPVEQWEDEAMQLIPIPGEKPRSALSSSKGTIDGADSDLQDKYYLDVDWNIRKTPIPYLPNPFDLEPTTNAEWPYWYRTTMDNRQIWVLLHHSQILSILPSYSGQPGVGTSSTWICLGFLGEHVLAIDERYEAMIDAPKNGLLGISGINETAQEVRDQIEYGDAADAPPIDSMNQRPGRPPANNGAIHDWTLITSNEKISFDSFKFRQNDGVPFLSRQQHFEDVLALAFDETIQSVVVRGGIGYGAQSETAHNNVAEGGVFALLQATEVALGTIYPRVTIRVTKVNDRARQLQLALLDRFASALAKLPIDTFTREETRAIIDREIMTIPATGEGQIQNDARAGSNAENDDQAQNDKAAPTTKQKEKAEAMAIIRHLNELILDDLADIDDLMEQMLAMQPHNEHAAALAAARQLTAAPLTAIPLQPDYPTIVLQRLRDLQKIMSDMDLSP